MGKYRRSVNRGGSQLNRVHYKFEDNLNDSGTLGDDLVPNTGNTNWSYVTNGLSGKYVKNSGGGKWCHLSSPSFIMADERGDAPFSVTIALKKETTNDFTDGFLLMWGNSRTKLRFIIENDGGILSASVHTGGAINDTNNFLKATLSSVNINDDYIKGDWIIVQARYSGQGKWKDDALELIIDKTSSIKSTATGTYEGMQDFEKSGSLQTVFNIGSDRYGSGGTVIKTIGYDSIILHEGDLSKTELDAAHDAVKNGNTINLLS